MKRLMMIATCLGLANLASGQLALEDFDGGTWPPTGWAVVDNIGNGQSWDTSSAFTHGNQAGSGECAAIDSDDYGSVDIDGELITPAFDIPIAGLFLMFDHYFYHVSPEFGDIDLSVNGGAWTNLAQYTGSTDGFVGINLSAYAGSTDCQIRFHYYNANYEWYWHVDNVRVDTAPPPPVNIWFEDFDSLTWPPTGWSVVDNIGNGNGWDTSSAFDQGNLAGFGECAAIDSDYYGSGVAVDGELITPSFPVNGLGTEFGFDHYFNWFGPEFADVDISVGGGAWTNVLQYTADTEGHVAIDLDPYVGMNVEFRFHYYNADYEYYWHIDNVGQFPASGTGTPYCFGDGSGTQCPCGNNNDGSVLGAGCANGVFASGAKLSGSGVASISADTLVLSATGLDPDNSGLYFQANDDLSPGIIWGDGLQCAGGQLKRLGVRFADATGASDTSAWTTPISVWAGNVLAGDTKRYQLWYRDTSGGQPCGVGINDFNATNGLKIVWTP